jgi:hypothetical protein
MKKYILPLIMILGIFCCKANADKFGAFSQSPPFPGCGKLKQSYIKAAALAASSTTTIFNSVSDPNITVGPGTVTRFWFAVLGDANTYADYTSRILFYFDGNSTPQINSTLGEMFGVGEQGVSSGQTFRGAIIGCTTNNEGRFSGYVYLKMPYYTSVRVDFNNMDTCGCTYWAQLETVPMNPSSLSSVGLQNGMYLRTAYLPVVTNIAAYAETTLLDVNGPVILCGWAQNIYNYSGANLYYLEGPYKIYYDSNSIPSSASSGTEDELDSSWYFGNESAYTKLMQNPPAEGLIYYPGGSPYSVDICKFWPLSNAPYAANHLKLTWTNGVSGSGNPGNQVQTRALIWYYH